MRTFILIQILALLINSCTKSVSQPSIKGTVVYRSCATIVVQVLDEQHKNLGQDWQQSKDSPAFVNVFAVANTCSFPSNIKEGQQITFKVINSDPANKDCVRCEMFDNPPTKTQLIKVE